MGADEPRVRSIMTVGHSTRTLAEFLELLQAHDVTLLIDIRTIPRSRYNPQFNQDTFPEALKTAGIGYAHLPALGGLRKAQPDSINTGWRNSSFRGFADYMQTAAFEAGIASLLKPALLQPTSPISAGFRTPVRAPSRANSRGQRVAIMCAEAVPWRCHRSLVADALVARGVVVAHLMNPTQRSEHALNPMANVHGLRVTYPSQEEAEAPRRGKVKKGAGK